MEISSWKNIIKVRRGGVVSQDWLVGSELLRGPSDILDLRPVGYHYNEKAITGLNWTFFEGVRGRGKPVGSKGKCFQIPCRGSPGILPSSGYFLSKSRQFWGYLSIPFLCQRHKSIHPNWSMRWHHSNPSVGTYELIISCHLANRHTSKSKQF